MACRGLRVAAALLATLLVALPARAALSDSEIQTLVEVSLRDKKITGLRVSVKDAVVTLAGIVPTAWAKARAIELALKPQDVKSLVVDELQVARGESDAQVAEAVANRVRSYVLYTVFDDVNLAVREGVVTLTGRVTMGFKVKDIEDVVSRVIGVQEVRNELQVLPTSIADEQIRNSVASQIYGDLIFESYAFQVNPPIHIIVENSRVTLTGVVNNQLERTKAEMIARAVFGVMAVENKLQLERR
ncbi:MAG: BON domain-containing protein [Solirubrobacterales bacterium]